MLRRGLALAAIIVVLTGILMLSQRESRVVKVSGFIEADEMRLGSRVGGRVAEVMTEEGARVAAGDPLLRLEPFDLVQLERQAVAELAERQAEYDRLTAGYQPLEVAQAKSRYEQASAQLEALENGPRPEEIDAARGHLEAAQVELSLAETNHERSTALLRDNAISRQEFDTVEERLNLARSMVDVRGSELRLLEVGTRAEELREARARVDEARAAWELLQEGYRGEEIRRAEAARDAATASLAAVRLHIEELVIRSPVDGVVEALELQAGDLVSAGAPVLAVIDLRRLWVRAYVPENQLDLRLGDRLPVTVDSFPGQRFTGELTFVARQAEFTPSNVQTPEERSKQVFRIKVQLAEGLDRLRPGMAADVWLDEGLDR